MNREEMNKALGLTEEELDAIALEYENDTWDPSVFGEPRPGRPLLYGEPMQTVTFKEPESITKQIDARASELNLSRSDYLRMLVAQDLATAQAS